MNRTRKPISAESLLIYAYNESVVKRVTRKNARSTTAAADQQKMSLRYNSCYRHHCTDHLHSTSFRQSRKLCFNHRTVDSSGLDQSEHEQKGRCSTTLQVATFAGGIDAIVLHPCEQSTTSRTAFLSNDRVYSYFR